mmetsp:Transcript_9604/g.16243  ORF Transcript_9604/g.16243 Transcript_9604/m.16243 type:complete len:311 (+) Transcript_9604:51-983(+)
MSSSHNKPHIWFTETMTQGYSVQTAISNHFHSTQSKFQYVEVVDTPAFGKCLILDGHIQSSSKDEFIYHESLVHTAMLSHPNPKNVFIAGGGEGATLREVLRHKSVEKCFMVDIDADAVEVSKKYLGSHHDGAFEDPRTVLVLDDAKKWLENTDSKFDVMVMDLADPLDNGPCFLLYTVRFYEFCATKLSENGVLVTQAGPAGMFTASQVNTAITKTVQKAFANARLMLTHVPSFSDMYGFAVASNADLPNLEGKVDELLAERLSDPSALRHFDDETYGNMIRLPKYVRKALAEEKRLITEETPLYICDL